LPLNVQGISYKEDQLDNILAKRSIKISAILESKRKLKVSKETHRNVNIDTMLQYLQMIRYSWPNLKMIYNTQYTI
jgi:hypothetical protein